MCGCETWTIKKAEHQRIDAFELWFWWRLKRCKETLERCKETLERCKIKPVNPQGNQSWIFTGRTEADAEPEASILLLPDAKNWLVGKNPDAGNDWRQKEKGVTGWDGWMTSPTWRTWVWASPRSWYWTRKPGVLQSVRGVAKSRTWLRDWTELK